MRKRYDPLDIRGYPNDWSDATFEHLNQLRSPVGIGMNWGPARGIKNGYMFDFDRFLEIGINAITPIECAADMDVVALGREYSELRMIGNISREAIMSGKDAIDTEREVPGCAQVRTTGFDPLCYLG